MPNTGAAADAAPHAPAYTTPVQARLSDTDALGHFHNASYAVFAEVGRVAFLADAGVDVNALILARLEVDFRRQGRFGDAVLVDSWVERVGETSVTLGQRVRAAGAVAAEVRSVAVHFDYAAGRPAPWPGAARAALLARVPVARPPAAA